MKIELTEYQHKRLVKWLADYAGHLDCAASATYGHCLPEDKKFAAACRKESSEVRNFVYRVIQGNGRK